MLTEKRQDEILKVLNEKESVTVQELKDMFQASESTIRRDLTTLHKKGKLVKVFGGAVLNCFQRTIYQCQGRAHLMSYFSKETDF